MTLPKNEKIDEAKKLYKAGKKLVDIARELGVPDGTSDDGRAHMIGRKFKRTFGTEKSRTLA